MTTDEADALSTNPGCFSREVVRTLLTEVENNRTNLTCILAGHLTCILAGYLTCIFIRYPIRMEHLMKIDPGLQRRFPGYLQLPDYSAEQIAKMTQSMARQRGFHMPDSLYANLAAHIRTEHAARMSTHNGGLAVELLEVAISNLVIRVVDRNLPNDDPRAATLTAADFGFAELDVTESASAAPAPAIMLNHAPQPTARQLFPSASTTPDKKEDEKVLEAAHRLGNRRQQERLDTKQSMLFYDKHAYKNLFQSKDNSPDSQYTPDVSSEATDNPAEEHLDEGEQDEQEQEVVDLSDEELATPPQPRSDASRQM